MTMLSTIRDRFSPSMSASFPSTESQRDASAETGGDATLPFAGYNRLDARQIAEALPDHSQIELEAVESYERSHGGPGSGAQQAALHAGERAVPRL